jgi:ATP-dependent protease ClpP protease subunit
MTDDTIWRKRMAAKLAEALKTVYEPECKGVLLMFAMKQDDGVYMHIQSNGGDECSPADMARAMKSCAPSIASKAYEVKDQVQ